MKLNITMNHLGDIVIKHVELNSSASVGFECFGDLVTFDFSVANKNLMITSNYEMCLLDNGKVNLLDCKSKFTFPLQKGFSLIYPAVDMYTKFDFNY